MSNLSIVESFTSLKHVFREGPVYEEQVCTTKVLSLQVDKRES